MFQLTTQKRGSEGTARVLEGELKRRALKKVEPKFNLKILIENINQSVSLLSDNSR